MTRIRAFPPPPAPPGGGGDGGMLALGVCKKREDLHEDLFTAGRYGKERRATATGGRDSAGGLKVMSVWGGGLHV